MRLNKNLKPLFWLALGLWILLGASRVWSARPGQQPSGSPVINEFLAANVAGLADEDGDYSDWLEIYNHSSTAVNLAGWSLTDDPDDPEKWTFPDLTLGSRDYLLVFASGKDRKSTAAGAQLHTNFKLDRAGEFLALYNILDQTWLPVAPDRFPPQLPDISYGRSGGGYGFFAAPTPNQANPGSATWQGRVAPVEFSANRGFYDVPFTLELATATPGATIRFTTDGSEPTETAGSIYTAPLEITGLTFVRAAAFKPGYLPAESETRTYLFLDDILAQSAATPPGFPDHWGLAQRDIWEYKKGQPVPADYELDPGIVNDPRYSRTIKDDLKSIPSLSIVTAAQNYDIYANPQQRGPAWERPVSVELIDPHNALSGFQINAGLRIHGARGREEYIPKHSFRLSFRNDYGAARLQYPLFDASPVDEFDTLILRGGVNRSYAGQLRSDKTGFELTTYTRDEWLRTSQIEMSGSGAHGIFVHLYLNGLYWGLYNVVERPDADFMAAYFGGDEQDWFVMNAGGPVDGPEEAFETLQYELYNINDLPYEERYPALKQRIDTAHFADYVILNWYAGVRDWPHNNWYAGIRLPRGQIRYFVWDGEVTWVDGARITFGDGDNTVKQFFEALIQYPDFQLEFADRLYKHLFNDGALTDANAQARWLRLNEMIDRAIVGESARWGDTRYDEPITRDDWLKARDAVLAQMDGNAARLISQAREAGYYPDIDPPLFNRPGGLVSAGFRLMLRPPDVETPANEQQRLIYYTTGGSDPRLPGSGDIAPTARIYSAPLALTATTHIKARTFVAGSESPWSALNEATFTVAAREQDLLITEIMYNPPGGSDYEFLELKNTGPLTVDLSQMHFEGIDFSFPVGAKLAPGEYLILASNRAAFESRYPGRPVAGVYNGQLSNQGEQIILKDANGEPVTAVRYDDENGWPLTADGRGDSLEFTGTGQNPDDPKNWRASPQLHGSPGS